MLHIHIHTQQLDTDKKRTLTHKKEHIIYNHYTLQTYTNQLIFNHFLNRLAGSYIMNVDVHFSFLFSLLNYLTLPPSLPPLVPLTLHLNSFIIPL